MTGNYAELFGQWQMVMLTSHYERCHLFDTSQGYPLVQDWTAVPRSVQLACGLTLTVRAARVRFRDFNLALKRPKTRMCAHCQRKVPGWAAYVTLLTADVAL
jgi:hypothetical protein